MTSAVCRGIADFGARLSKMPGVTFITAVAGKAGQAAACAIALATQFSWTRVSVTLDFTV